MNVEKLKKDLMSQDDDSIGCVAKHLSGKYSKTVNRYPYQAVFITEKEYLQILSELTPSGYLKKSTEFHKGLAEFYSKY